MYSQDGKVLATLFGSELELWNPKTGQLQRSIHGEFAPSLGYETLYHYLCTLTGFEKVGMILAREKTSPSNPEARPCPSQLYAYVYSFANSWKFSDPASASANGSTSLPYSWGLSNVKKGKP
jgi:hypothetical protein